jgi:outer membrane protein OmpA-like peptidoglycan-associated protein
MLVWAIPAAAQDPASEPDEEGCKDSKLISRMTGCRLHSCESREFDAYDIVVGRYSAATDWPKRTLEGQVEKLGYICPAKVSGLQIARNMENALKAAGFGLVISHRESDEYYVTANKGAQWIEILVQGWNDQFQYTQTAVLVKAMEQQVVADASAMEAEIHRTGSVALYGINFDTGKATLQAGSEKMLGEIVKLMKDHTDWRFEVQGHTDNVGAKGANLTLSEQRAKTVVEWLTKNGVAAARLVAKGYGDTVPLMDNATEDGRAKNRRVELKKLNDE